MKSNKGSIDDMALLLVVAFGVAVAFLVLFVGFDAAINALVANPQINSSGLAVDTLNTTHDVLPRLDYLFLMVFIGMALAIIVISLLVAGNPIFMFLYMLALIVMTTGATILSFAWDSIIAKTSIASIISNFVIANHIIHYLGYYFAAVGGVAFIAMFIRLQMINNG